MPIIPRMSRPYRFDVSREEAVSRQIARKDEDGNVEPIIPGVAIRDDGIWCARDTVEIVGRYLGRHVSEDEIKTQQWVTPEDWPGWNDYERLFARDVWPHQPSGGAFLAARSAAFQCDPARTGKNTSVLIACTLVNARQVVIATNGTPKLGWAEDIAKWFKVSPLILEGRRGDDAWLLCVPCRGTGVVTPANKPERCDACRGRGKKRGGWVKPTTSIEEALATSRFIVVNYDILIGQKVADKYGAVSNRADMKGWIPKIKKYARKFDTLVCDEIQKVGDRGYRRAALKELSKTPDRVYAPTATPTDGRIIKLYSPLDIVSGGMWGKSKKRFATRYADGFFSTYGLEVPSNGRSFASELSERLSHYMIKRSDAEINPMLPTIRRQVVRIDADVSDNLVITSPSEGSVKAVLDATARIKCPTVVEAAVDALSEGKKIVVYTRERAPGIAIYNEVVKKFRSAEGAEMRNQNAELWCSIGKSSDSRVQMADAFSAHQGAAYFGATIDGFQTGRSLLGVNFNFYADLHWSADAINQTERRSLLYGRKTGLVSVFFVVSGSTDEDVISVLIPKLETLELVLNDDVAADYRTLLAPQETIDEIFARHTAHLRGAT